MDSLSLSLISPNLIPTLPIYHHVVLSPDFVVVSPSAITRVGALSGHAKRHPLLTHDFLGGPRFVNMAWAMLMDDRGFLIIGHWDV